MNKLIAIVLVCLSVSGIRAQSDSETAVHRTLDAWHKAAAEADFEGYFGRMTRDAIFIGTDASENWGAGAFQSFAKPYFDRGRAWDFTAVERHVFFGEQGTIAWFDELLDTWMGLCRGSGVLLKEGSKWKIAHYVLSIAVPNENVNEVLAIKKAKDSILIQDLKSKFRTATKPD